MYVFNAMSFTDSIAATAAMNATADTQCFICHHHYNVRDLIFCMLVFEMLFDFIGTFDVSGLKSHKTDI